MGNNAATVKSKSAGNMTAFMEVQHFSGAVCHPMERLEVNLAWLSCRYGMPHHLPWRQQISQMEKERI